MQTYTVVSLVDITRSNPDRSCTDKIKLGQQANFNSLLQAIGLRSNVEWQQDPKVYDGRLPEPFEGRGTYWTWTFFIERDWVFAKNNNDVGLLLEDLQGVPIVDQLNNSVDLNPSIFQTNGPKKNIWIFKI